MSHFITYLALSSPASVTESETVAAMRELAGQAPFRVEGAGRAQGASGEAFILTVNSLAVTVMFIDAPLPQDAWEEAAQRSLTWKEAGTVLPATRAHVIVALLANTHDHRSSLAGASAVTVVAGALARLLPVAGTLFIESGALLAGAGVTSMAMSLVAGTIPDVLWTTLQFFRGELMPDGNPMIGALTQGLFPFIGREVQFEAAALPPDEVAKRLLGLCQYLAVNGLVIKDGETVGLTPGEKIRVSYEAEGLRPGTPLMKLTLESTAPVPPPAPSPAPASANTPRLAVFGKKGT
jgi:Domain of unknown function (DUF4261)